MQSSFIKVLKDKNLHTSKKRRSRYRAIDLRKNTLLKTHSKAMIEKVSTDNYVHVFKSPYAYCFYCNATYESEYILESHLYYSSCEPDYDSVRCPICDEKKLITPKQVDPKHERLIITLIQYYQTYVK
uniref:Uncharacterized protein n=1 Tax=Clandestinovirus TaxID=2831644 RepID=A0A8F8KNQ4_9VIRU|nr:hypothetical protein KOM_12_16 [Clandestinovirus]